VTLQESVDRVCRGLEVDRGRGRMADYIPALARVDARRFGAAVLRLDGELACYGDARVPFSLQSITKVFALVLALERQGEALWQRVGREPSGNPFNSIVQLEHEQGIPRNPLINAGAIVVADELLRGRSVAAAAGALRDFLRRLAGDDAIDVDAEVAASEARSGSRNRSLAHFMAGFGRLEHPVEEVLGLYFRQCALAASCAQLARAVLPLAAAGVDPRTGERVFSPGCARRVNAVMLLCGHYDASGDFAYRVGLPGKSGVGGGIVCVAPGHGALAVWSPGLDDNGNSLLGTLALEALVEALGWRVL